MQTSRAPGIQPFQQAPLLDGAGRVVRRPDDQGRRPDAARPLRVPGVAGAHVGLLEDEHVAHAPHGAGAGVDGQAHRDELVGDEVAVGRREQPLQPRAHRLRRGLGDRAHGRVAHRGHRLRLAGHVARRGQHEPVDALGMVGGHPRGDPPAQRLARQVHALQAQRIEQREQVVGVDVEGVRAVGPVAEAVPRHVVGDHAEVLAQRREVAQIGLGVPAGAVQQHERRARSGLDHACGHAAGRDHVLAQRRAHQLGPQRRGGVAHRGQPSSSRGLASRNTSGGGSPHHECPCWA